MGEKEKSARKIVYLQINVMQQTPHIQMLAFWYFRSRNIKPTDFLLFFLPSKACFGLPFNFIREILYD